MLEAMFEASLRWESRRLSSRGPSSSSSPSLCRRPSRLVREAVLRTERLGVLQGEAAAE